MTTHELTQFLHDFANDKFDDFNLYEASDGGYALNVYDYLSYDDKTAKRIIRKFDYEAGFVFYDGTCYDTEHELTTIIAGFDCAYTDENGDSNFIMNVFIDGLHVACSHIETVQQIIRILDIVM